MSKQLFRRATQGFLLMASVGTLAFGFNNCGKSPTAEFDAAQVEPYDTKVEKLSAKYHGTFDSQFCSDAKNYSCVHKVFSPNTESADLGVSSQDCVRMLSGGEICPEVHHYAYNTQKAVEVCKKNCKDTYDFQDYDCHLKLGISASGVYPLIVTEDNLSGSIETLYSSCRQIQRGVKE